MKKKCDDMRNSILLILVIASISSMLLASFVFDAEAYQKDSKRYDQDSTENKVKTQFNKYYNYVHLQPEWDSYPLNILFDVTAKWIKDDVDNSSKPKHEKPHQGAQQRTNQLQYLEGKSYLEVKYDYIDCSYQWIHYARYGTDMVVSHLDYLAGRQTDLDNFTSFSMIPGSDKEEVFESKMSEEYSQFIPICTSKDQTSFDYGVRIDDKGLGFDVYFVPSVHERYNFHYNQTAFTHYDDEGCFGKNYQSFSGTCSVNKEGGLLIVIPDELQRSLTKVTVKLNENMPIQ